MRNDGSQAPVWVGKPEQEGLFGAAQFYCSSPSRVSLSRMPNCQSQDVLYKHGLMSNPCPSGLYACAWYEGVRMADLCLFWEYLVKKSFTFSAI